MAQRQELTKVNRPKRLLLCFTNYETHMDQFKRWLHLRLTELHQLQDVTFEAVVFGSGVGEDIDEGPGQRDLQSFLYGSNAHLGTVAATLTERIAYQKWKNGLEHQPAGKRYFQIKTDAKSNVLKCLDFHYNHLLNVCNK